MILKLLLILVVLLLLWILFVPVIIQADTSRRLYRIMLPGVVSAAMVSGGSLFKIRIWAFFVPFSIDPFSRGNAKRGGRKEDSSGPEKRKRRGGLLSGIRNGKRYSRVLRAIKVKKFHLDIDTDDFILNAQLFPAFALASSFENVELRTNFRGELFFALDVRVRLGEVFWLMFMSRVRRPGK